MNIRKMIEDLQEQITVIQETVVTLEKLESLSTGVKRRGRPPKWMTSTPGEITATEGKRTRRFSTATRKKMVKAQRRRWAATARQQKKAESKSKSNG